MSRVVVAAAMGLALALPGCGGGGHKTDTSASTRASKPPAATAPAPNPPPPTTAPAPIPNAFPPGTRKTFVDSCTRAGAARAVCSCTYAKLKARFSYPEFVALLQRVHGHELPSPLRRAVTECRGAG